MRLQLHTDERLRQISTSLIAQAVNNETLEEWGAHWAHGLPAGEP